jgi:hypothetical protein
LSTVRHPTDRGYLVDMLLLLTACPQPETDDATDKDTEPGTCAEIEAAFEAETDAIRSCTDASECGQELPGTSCGCTQNWVARTDADTTEFYALIEEAAGTCDLGLASDCSCPEAYGFDCVDNTCTWDYADSSAGLPDCRADRGDDYDVEGASVAGDTLTVSIGYGGGCETHEFTLCWPDPTFAESAPVQTWLEIFHEANDDMCDAYFVEDVTFDLTPLRDAWRAAYGATSGTITVHVGGQSVEYTF